MESHRTTTSGNRLTLITGMGMAPVDQREAERLCRIRIGAQPDEQTSDHPLHAAH